MCTEYLKVLLLVNLAAAGRWQQVLLTTSRPEVVPPGVQNCLNLKKKVHHSYFVSQILYQDFTS